VQFFIYLYHGGQDEGFYMPACHKPNVGGNAIMKYQLLIILLTFGCSTLEQNDFIEVKELGKTTRGTIVYKLYQTGIDNYR